MRKSPLLAVFLTVVIDLLGFGIVLPLLPLYGEAFDARGITLSLLFISFSAMQFVASPIWGRFSDRFGRRPIILIGLTGSVASYTLFGLAPGMSAALFWLFVSRIVAGVFGGTISTAYAYIADVTTTKERGRGMALIGAAFGIGFTLGPTIGGLGYEHLGPGAPGYIAAGFSFVALLFAAFRLPEPERHAEHRARSWFDLDAFRTAMRTPAVGTILMTGFVSVGCFALLEATLSVLAKHRYQLGIGQIGLLFSYFGLWSAVNQGYVVRKMMKRMGERTLILWGPVLLGAGLLVIGAASVLLEQLDLGFGWRLAALLVIAPLPVLGFGMIMPSLNSLLSRATDPTTQGGVLGVNQSLQSLSRIIGPFVGLSLFYVNDAVPFLLGAVTMLLAMGLAVKIRRTPLEDRY